MVCLSLLALATINCSSSDDAGAPPGETPMDAAGPEPDTGTDPDSGTTDSGTTMDAGPAPMAVNGCTAAAFAEAAAPTIFIGRDGLVFTPKCLTVAQGTTVRWEGSLTAHPIAPGNPDNPQAGSPGNPIQPTATGNSVEFTFTAPGTYPYYCELHSFGAGSGMAGAVFVR
jgi:plastocyanin